MKNALAARARARGALMVKLCVDSPALAVDAATLWRARTTSLFMTCERAVFGDLESSVVLYERCRHDENRARCVIRTKLDAKLPYMARRALGVKSSRDAVVMYDDVTLEETQSTAPYLFEASSRTYGTFLNPENSVLKGTVLCKSVDDGSMLSVRLECAVKMTGIGSAIERTIVSGMKTKFALYPKVIELYKAKLRENEAKRRERDEERAAKASIDACADACEFHSARDSDSERDDVAPSLADDRVADAKKGDATSPIATGCCVPASRRRSRSSNSNSNAAPVKRIP